MMDSDEVVGFSPHDLKLQIETNSNQLTQLRVLSRTARVGTRFMLLVLAALMAVITFLVAALLFPKVGLLMRSDFLELSGPILVLAIFLSVQATRELFSSWARAAETEVLIKRQEQEIHRAENVLHQVWE